MVGHRRIGLPFAQVAEHFSCETYLPADNWVISLVPSTAASMAFFRHSLSLRDLATTYCGLLAIGCWLALSVLPILTQKQDARVSGTGSVVVPAEQFLGTPGPRSESQSTKSHWDNGHPPLVLWISTTELLADSAANRPASLWAQTSLLPANSLLSLGLGLRL